MRHIPGRLRKQVIKHAGNRCEFCKLSQEGQEATFHIDHAIPVSAGGETILANLALACVSCSLHKAARQRVQDPKDKKQVPLYNPRKEHWEDHFRWEGVVLIGITAIGRATVEALNMNRKLILAIRREEMLVGRHPPEKPSW